MEKINSIKINGKNFRLTDSAYSLLKEYDRFIRKNVSDSHVIVEIEVQMSVILETGNPNNINIIQIRDIEEAINLIGVNEKINFKRNSSRPFEQKRTKVKREKTDELFRDKSDSVLGGVCSGIANYLGIDPVIVRVAFIGLTLMTGFFFLIYIILWIFLPDQSRILK